uniref:(northern house mosquito) hypothetical protein n=1 Tax=Culex pipiens TaxID=7175 RepID=A0A8D8H4N4_CULPI
MKLGDLLQNHLQLVITQALLSIGRSIALEGQILKDKVLRVRRDDRVRLWCQLLGVANGSQQLFHLGHHVLVHANLPMKHVVLFQHLCHSFARQRRLDDVALRAMIATAGDIVHLNTQDITGVVFTLSKRWHHLEVLHRNRTFALIAAQNTLQVFLRQVRVLFENTFRLHRGGAEQLCH